MFPLSSKIAGPGTSEKKPNIYFAGGIRGGGGDTKLYASIIKILSRFGTVLTSHLANPDVQEHKLEDVNDRAIFLTDMQELRRSDILVTEVSAPSLGVGYKIAKAESLGIPTIALLSEQSTYALSALIAGNAHVNVLIYRDVASCENGLRELFEQKFSYLYGA